jgi:hypothetical protein
MYTINNAPKYFVEVSTDTTLSHKKFMHWARRMRIDEHGSEEKVGRWYQFPFNTIREARQFRARVKRELKGIDMVRIFKTKFLIYEDHKVVE